MRVVADKNGVKINNIDIKEWKRVDEMLRAYRVITNDIINFPFLEQILLKAKGMAVPNKFQTFPAVEIDPERSDVFAICAAIKELQSEVSTLKREVNY